MTISIKSFFDQNTFSFSYLVSDQSTGEAAIIDPILDYDPSAASIKTTSAESILELIKSEKLNLKWILETHIHADHITAAFWLKQQTGASIVISENICQVQQTFNLLYGFSSENLATEKDFDRLVKDEDILMLGDTQIRVIQTPGHTPTCCTYVIEDNAFVGDTLFMPDFGTARCDFPDGNAKQLYNSIQKTLSLADNTNLFMCHDYMPNGRELKNQTTVAEQKLHNIHINQNVTESEFVKMRETRDAQLKVPKLILPALQINIKAGRLPATDDNGDRFLKLPINKL